MASSIGIAPDVLLFSEDDNLLVTRFLPGRPIPPDELWLPLSRHLAKVHPTLRTPIWSCIAVAVIAAIPMLKYAGAGIVAIAATAMIYLSYFLGNAAIMWARTRGWPKVDSPFRVGRWGIIVNVLALAWGGGMLINFAWPRAASNPEPNQTNGALSLGVDGLNKIPILYTVLLFAAIIGVIYYFAVARRNPMAVVVPPETGPVVIPPESLAPDEVV